MKVNGETCERLGLSVKQNTTIHGQAERGVTMVDRCLQGATK